MEDMQGLTRTARGLRQPTATEARIMAALSGLGAELAVSMPAHSSQALRAHLMASAADPSFMAAGAGHAAGTAHATGHTVAVVKGGAVTAKLSSAIAPFVAPVAAGVLATNLAVAGAFVANHQGSAPVAPAVIVTQSAAQKAQAELRSALTGQIAKLGALGYTYDQLTPAQVTAWLQQWTTGTTGLLDQLSSKVDVRQFVQLAQSEISRLSPLLPAPAVVSVNHLLGAVVGVAASPTPGTLPTPLPTIRPTAPATHTPLPLPTDLPTQLPVPLPTDLPVPLPTLPVPLPGITLGPVKIGPL